MEKASWHSWRYRQLDDGARVEGRGLSQIQWQDHEGGILRKNHRHMQPTLWFPRSSVQLTFLLDCSRLYEDIWLWTKNPRLFEKGADSQAMPWSTGQANPSGSDFKNSKAAGSRLASF